MEEQDYPIRVNVAIGRSPDEVWPYITEVEHWNEWNAASLSSAEWEEGGKLNWKVGGFSSILAPLIPARTVHFQLVGVFTQDTVFTLEPSGDGRSTEFAVHEKYMGVALSDGGATKRARWESDLARLKNLVESGATPVSVSEEGEPFLGRIRELIAAGEKFEAMKLYAKTTGKGPDLAKKYVDEVASRMSGGHGSSIRAERREVTIVGKTLEEAHAKLQALISTDGLLLKSKIANKGERRITESGSTVDEAFAKAEKKLLGEEEVIRRRVISEPVERTVTVKAPDPDHARDRAKQSLAKAEKVAQVTELTAGRRRLLGLVSAVNEYCVVIRVKKAVVEVVCSCPAEIRATISQSEQVGENSANDIEVFNAVTAVLWKRSVQDSIARLKAAGDAAVPCVLSEITGAAEGRVGAPNWWDGAVQLCGVLEAVGTPVAKDALLTVLAMDSRIVEFDRVRASAAKRLSSFSDSAPDLVPKLIKLLDSPHAPLAQIQSAIDELGGEAPVTPELLLEKAAYMAPAEAIQHLGAYQKQAAGWNPDQRRHFFWLLGNKVDAAFRHHGPKDGDLATRLSRPYHAAALLADPSPDVTSWTKFGVIAVERSEERAKLLAAQYPLPETPPIPSESDALGGT